MPAIDDYGFELGVECAWPNGWNPGREAPADQAPAEAASEPAGLLRQLLERLADGGRLTIPAPPPAAGPGLMKTG